MNRMAKANLLALSLIMLQLLLVLVINGFQSEISSFLPVFDTIYGLLTINQLFSVLMPTVIFTVFFCRTEKVKASELLRIYPVSGKNILLIVVMSLFIQPLMGVLSLVTQLVFSNNVGVLAFTLAEEMSYLPIIASIAVMPAIFEELALRGAILGAYGTELDERRTILINGLFFGMIHLDGQQLLYAIALGVFFSFIVLRTGSIFAGIIAHFTVNATQATLLFLMKGMLELYETPAENVVSAAEISALPEGIGAFSTVSVLLSFVMVFVIVGVSYVVFFRLLTKFSKLNPAKTDNCGALALDEEIRGDDGHVPDEAAVTPPEIEGLKNALASRKRFTNSFYISFFAVIAVYMSVMSISGVVQALFLLGVFSFFLFTLFFLRVGS